MATRPVGHLPPRDHLAEPGSRQANPRRGIITPVTVGDPWNTGDSRLSFPPPSPSARPSIGISRGRPRPRRAPLGMPPSAFISSLPSSNPHVRQGFNRLLYALAAAHRCRGGGPFAAQRRVEILGYGVDEHPLMAHRPTQCCKRCRRQTALMAGDRLTSSRFALRRLAP